MLGPSGEAGQPVQAMYLSLSPSRSSRPGTIEMAPLQSSSRPLQISATGQTVTGSGAAVEHTYQLVLAGVRPKAEKQLLLVMSQATTMPARHCPTPMPQVMPL